MQALPNIEVTRVSPLREEDPQDQNNSFQLRDYQKKIIRQVYTQFRSRHQKDKNGHYGGGKKSCLIYLPTGAGKTAIASQMIADAVMKGRKVLFIVHRKPLVGQTVRTLKKFFNIDCGVIWGGDEAKQYNQDLSLPVQVAMLQSLQSRELPPDMGLVIIDECHTTGPGWKITQKIFDYYTGGVLSLSKTYFVGLTGSPWRAKRNEGFCHLFDCLVKGPYPVDLIKDGYLCPVRHFGFGGIADFSKLEVDQRTGDYTIASIRNVCNEEYNSSVVNYYLEFAKTRKTIFFCAFVEQVKDLTRQLQAAEIQASFIVGETQDWDRLTTFKQFKNGEIQALVSCDALIEGYDETSIEAVVIARPTRSLPRLIQMCGRGARKHPGKQDCFFLDFGGNFQRLGLFTRKHSLSLCPKPMRDIKDKECPECHSMVSSFCLICPECGHEFPRFDSSSELDEEDWDEPVFGELLSPEEEKQLRYIRQQMKTKYTKGQNPSRVMKLFYEKFNYIPPNEWFIGAIFGMKNVYANMRIYRNFLTMIRPDASESWIKQMMEMEFGKEGTNYRTQAKKTYTAPKLDLKNYSWWDILELNAEAPIELIKWTYRELAKQWHPDICKQEHIAEDMMKLINHAYEQAKKERGF